MDIKSLEAIKVSHRRIKSTYKTNDNPTKEDKQAYKASKKVFKQAKAKFIVRASQSAIKIQSHFRRKIIQRSMASSSSPMNYEPAQPTSKATVPPTAPIGTTEPTEPTETIEKQSNDEYDMDGFIAEDDSFSDVKKPRPPTKQNETVIDDAFEDATDTDKDSDRQRQQEINAISQLKPATPPLQEQNDTINNSFEPPTERTITTTTTTTTKAPAGSAANPPTPNQPTINFELKAYHQAILKDPPMIPQPLSSSVPSSSLPKSNNHIEHLGRQLDLDLQTSMLQDTSFVDLGGTNGGKMDQKQTNDTPSWVMFGEPATLPSTAHPTTDTPATLPPTHLHLDVLHRILRLNQQAIDAMKDNYFSVAEKVFVVIHQLIETTNNLMQATQTQTTENDEHIQEINAMNTQKFLIVQISYLNNRACLCRKKKLYTNAMTFLQQALLLGRQLINRDKRLSEILPVLTNLACVASLRKRHLEAVSYAARAVLITTAIIDLTLVPKEQQIVCLFNLAAEMEHLGGKTKCMVGHVYHEAYNKSSVLLGPCHKLSVQLEQVIQLHPKTKTVENFSMAKLTATIMKMYGIRKPLRKKMHQHRPQQPQQNYMKGTNYMKSVANFYRSTTTNSSVGHKSTKQTPRRPASARRSRRSNGQTSRSNRFNQSSQQSPPQSSPQSPPQDVQDVQDVQSNQELSKNMTVHVMQVEQEKKKRKTKRKWKKERPASAAITGRKKNVPRRNENQIDRLRARPSSAPFRRRQGRKSPRHRGRRRRPVSSTSTFRLNQQHLSLEQRRQMFQASKRIRDHVEKEHSIAPAYEWPPKWYVF